MVVGILGLLAVFPQTLSSSKQSGRTAVLTHLTNEKMEQLRALDALKLVGQTSVPLSLVITGAQIGGLRWAQLTPQRSTALVALPQTRRAAYVEHLASLLPSQTRGLLVTLDYEQSDMDGPPFAVPPAEVRRLLLPLFRIEKLADADRLDTYPAFQKRGLKRLREQLFWLERR